MVSTLDQWRSRLHDQFERLAAMRRDLNLPVFALEHGLDHSEREAIAALLRESLRRGERLSTNWLIWVVYAAEQGYDYAGEEFWTTFEARTPLWSVRAERAWLRTWFGKFHTIYGGFKPTGVWASWFSIIAWPITHALLPKDLQHQLARVLFQFRFHLAARLDEPPAKIGRHIASLSYGSSSRFRNFLQQEEIVGRIALALLGGRAAEGQQFIHPSTLARIVDDLQEAGSARAWLRDARQAVQRAQLKGSSRVSPGMGDLFGTYRSVPQSEPAPQIRPALKLRRTSITEWTPLLELPSLRPIADVNADAGDFLRRTRCTVAGSAGMLPAGWLISGDQRRVLTEWPPTASPVVRFEHTNALVEHFLQSDGCITAGPLWLFRIGSDGLAREIVGRLVRPGRSYIIVSKNPLSVPALAEPVVLRCSGAHAYALHLSEHLSDTVAGALQTLGLSVAQTIEIWPAGLDARRWDGEGFSEWLEGESPCFGLSSDHPILAFHVQLDGGEPVRLSPQDPGAPLFLMLPLLSPGQHQLFVRAIREDRGDGVEQVPVEGFVSLVVRAPQPWISGTTNHSGLVVTTEPAEPSLDEFWKGESALQILGPAGHRVSVSAELLDGGGARISTEHVADLTLPMTAETWERATSAFLRNETDPWAFLSASAGTLLVDGDALGACRVALHREVHPVRWVWHKTKRSTALRLVDDHEGDDPLSVLFYPFRAPAHPTVVSKDDTAKEWIPDGDGGLCVATYSDQSQALVVSMPQVTGGFTGLLIEPRFDALPAGNAAVSTILDLVQLWSSARLAGPLASQRRDRVVQGLGAHLIRLLCGADWLSAEAAYARSPKNEQDLRRLADRVGAPAAFSIVLSRDAILYRSMAKAERLNHYASLAQRYRVADRDSCAAALDLCDCIVHGAPMDHAAKSFFLVALQGCPAALRGARLVAIAQPVRSPSRPPPIILKRR